MNPQLAFRRRTWRSRALFTPLALTGIVALTGCSNAGSTTCDEYAAKSYSERQSTSRALLQEHDLEPDAVSNTVGLLGALDSFCGLDGGFEPGTASRNGSSPLDDAVDWSAKSW